MKKLFVFHHTDAFMSAIIDQVRNGYTRYAMGTVAPDKVGSMAAKMAMFYKTDADRNERFRMKQNKLAPARLLIRERKSQTGVVSRNPRNFRHSSSSSATSASRSIIMPSLWKV